MDWQNCSTYANFVNMYDQCIDQMVQAGEARKRDQALWLYKTRKIVSGKSLAFGCKVTHLSCVHCDYSRYQAQ